MQHASVTRDVCVIQIELSHIELCCKKCNQLSS